MKPDIQEVIAAWSAHLKDIDWRDLLVGIQPVQTGCGPIYELTNPLGRPHESFVLADMRDLSITEPHYHPEETEIYFVLQGTGTIVVGGEQHTLEPGNVVVTNPDTAHFTIPEQGLVLAVVNTPPFKPENYVPLNRSNPRVMFDYEQYEQYLQRG